MEESTTHPAVPPQSAEKFMQDVRRKTRRKFTAEEKIRIVLEGMKRELTVTELCRREGMPTAVYYSWVKDFMEAGKARFKRGGRSVVESDDGLSKLFEDRSVQWY